MPLRQKQLNIFFMQFVDTITPSQPSQYYDTLKTIDDRSTWRDKPFQAANDWATMYYQNAYNTALLNYQNEYNTPLNQMLRYQEAGLNPFLAGQDAGNMGQYHSGGTPRGNFTAPTKVQEAAAVNQSINTLNQSLKTAQSIYDYIQYGRPLNEAQLNIQNWDAMRVKFDADSAQYLALQREAESAWARYWNLGQEGYVDPDNGDKLMSETPRARYMELSTERLGAQIDQLQSLVKVLYPSQAEASKASAALNLYKKEVLEGQKGAILQLDTGDPTRDAILKQVLFWLGDKVHF